MTSTIPAADTGRTLRPIGWTGPTGAQVTAHLRVFVALDNYTPPRDTASIMIERITWPKRDDGFIGIEISIPAGLDLFKDGDKALWMVDDGSSVTMYYTCGYHPEERYIGLKKVTPHMLGICDGFGPRRTYHLLVQEERTEGE